MNDFNSINWIYLKAKRQISLILFLTQNKFLAFNSIIYHLYNAGCSIISVTISICLYKPKSRAVLQTSTLTDSPKMQFCYQLDDDCGSESVGWIIAAIDLKWLIDCIWILFNCIYYHSDNYRLSAYLIHWLCYQISLDTIGNI